MHAHTDSMYAWYAPCLLQFTHVTHFPRADCWDQFPWQPPIIWRFTRPHIAFFSPFFFTPSFLLPGSLCCCERAREPPTNITSYPKCLSPRLVVYHTFKSCSRGRDALCLPAKPRCSLVHVNLSWIYSSPATLGGAADGGQNMPFGTSKLEQRWRFSIRAASYLKAPNGRILTFSWMTLFLFSSHQSCSLNCSVAEKCSPMFICADEHDFIKSFDKYVTNQSIDQSLRCSSYMSIVLSSCCENPLNDDSSTSPCQHSSRESGCQVTNLMLQRTTVSEQLSLIGTCGTTLSLWSPCRFNINGASAWTPVIPDSIVSNKRGTNPPTILQESCWCNNQDRYLIRYSSAVLCCSH